LLRSYLNCLRQGGLSFLKFFSMQALIRFTSGMNWPQNFIASWRQARRCSGVPAASAEEGAAAKSAITAQAMRAVVIGRIMVWFLDVEP
jgi:hypothetical protein